MFKKFRIFNLSLPILFLAAASCQAVPSPTSPTPTEVPPTAEPSPLPPTATPGPEVVMEPLWSVQTGGAIWGTPTVSNGILYIGSDDDNLYALKTQDGSQVWKFSAGGIIRSRPAIAGDKLFFTSDDGFLYALNSADGSVAWQTDIGNALERAQREALGTNPNPAGFDYRQSSPVVVNGKVFVGSLDGKIYSVDAGTGEVSWTYQTSEKVRATPLVQDEVVYIGSWDKYLYALDASMGKLVWKSLLNGQVQSDAVKANRLVITASRKASVIAVDAQTGSRKWEFDYGPNNWVESSPLLADDIVFIGSSMYKVVVGLASQTGEIRAWYDSPCIQWSTPVIVGNRLYTGGEWATNEVNSLGGIYGLDLVDGHFASMNQAQWYFPVLETLEPEKIFYGVAGSPVTDGDVLFFGGLDGKVYAVSIAS